MSLTDADNFFQALKVPIEFSRGSFYKLEDFEKMVSFCEKNNLVVLGFSLYFMHPDPQNDVFKKVDFSSDPGRITLVIPAKELSKNLPLYIWGCESVEDHTEHSNFSFTDFAQKCFIAARREFKEWLNEDIMDEAYPNLLIDFSFADEALYRQYLAEDNIVG